jgi:hypothetical protein
MRLRGRAENAALHGALFHGVLKGTKISAEIESIARLSDDIALVHTSGKKSGPAWLIRSFQNTRVQPFSIWITRWAQRRASRGQ